MSNKHFLVALAMAVTSVCTSALSHPAEVWSVSLEPARTDPNQLLVWLVLRNVSREPRLFCIAEAFYALEGVPAARAYRAGGTIISPALSNCDNTSQWQRVRHAERVATLLVLPVEGLPNGHANLAVNVTGYSREQFEGRDSPLVLGASIEAELGATARRQNVHTDSPEWALTVEHAGNSMAVAVDLTNVGTQSQILCATNVELLETLADEQDVIVTPLFTRRGAECTLVGGQLAWPYAWLVRPGHAWSKLLELPEESSQALKRTVRTCFFEMTPELLMLHDGRRTCVTTSVK